VGRKFAQFTSAVRVHVRPARQEAVFMGDEFGQVREWTHDGQAWNGTCCQYASSAACNSGLEQLNRMYREQPALTNGYGSGGL